MLSRIAESLYWIGRYLERAEDTARILDVHLYLTVEDPLADTQAVPDQLPVATSSTELVFKRLTLS